MAACRLAAASCHALGRAVHDKLRAVELQLRARHRSLAGASSSTTTSPAVAALGALLCVAAAFPRAAAFFLPLVASTSLCCAEACLSAAAEGGAAKDAAVEVVLVGGEGKAEAGLLQVIGEANSSAYGDGLGRGGDVQVGCFIRRSAKQGVDEVHRWRADTGGWAAVPIGTARHGSASIVPCLGWQFGTRHDQARHG